MNILELGKTHLYVNSQFSFYYYNLSSINSEYLKLMSNKDDIFNHLNNNLTFELKTYINVLKFNCEQLTNKIKIITSHRNKRGIINGLGTIVKTLTGNLDANDGRKYEELFEKINKNIFKLQNQNFETVKLNKEMISKFNTQLQNVKHNEEILKNQIVEIKNSIKENNEWRIITESKDALTQLILLTLSLKEIISEIETSISFCGLNKIHSSIINLEMLREIVKQSTKLDFIEIANLVKSHCRLQKNAIEYLIEIPVYDIKENVLFQITPIPIYHNNKLFMIDENEELITKRENEFIIIERCVRNKNKYFCHTNKFRVQECVMNVFKAQNDSKCMFHEISNSLIIQKIRNSNIVIVASNINVTMNIICNDYDKTKVVLGVFKIKTEKNCSLNGQLLELTKYYNKELILENVEIKINKNQITNKILDLKPINKQELLIKELRTIDDVNIDKEKSQLYVYITIAIVTVALNIVIFRKHIANKIMRIKQLLMKGELRNQQSNDPIKIQSHSREETEFAISL